MNCDFPGCSYMNLKYVHSHQGNTLLNKGKLVQNVVFVTERQTGKSKDSLTVTKRTRLRGNKTNGKSECKGAEESDSLRVHAGSWCS